MNKIAAAFEAAGMLPRDVAMRQAIALFINQGGTIERLRALVDEVAVRMPGPAMQKLSPLSDRIRNAAPRLPVEDGEANDSLPQGQKSCVSPSSPSRELGTIVAVPQGHGLPVPAREPSPSQRLAAISVAKTVATTVLDSFKIDGLAIGEWTVAEARLAGHRKTREGYILIEAARHVANANGSEKLRQVVKPQEMERIIQNAAEVADAV